MSLRRCSACLFATSTRLRSGPVAALTLSSRSSSSSSSSSDVSHSSGSSTSSSSSSSSSTPPPSSSPKDASSSDVAPPLKRPLGLSEPPRKHVKQTMKQRQQRLLDQDARMQERKHLIKEASTGYFEGYNEIRHRGGKQWQAPKALIQEKAALYFPEIEGTSLGKDRKDATVHTSELLKGKISLVGMLTTRISEEQVEGYSAPILDTYRNDPDFQYVQINCQENKLKWILVGIFISSLRRSIPEDLRANYLVSTQNLEYIREPLGMTNKHLGYVYLVDENSKIRWAAVSFPGSSGPSASEADTNQEAEEITSLRACTGVLLQRLRDSRTAGKAAAAQ